MMKNIFLMISVVCATIFIVLFESCSSNADLPLDDAVYGTIGTYEQSSGTSYFLLEDTSTMIPRNELNIPDSLIGSRFFLDFQKVAPSQENPNYDMTVNLLNIQRVVDKNILIATSKAQLDSIGVDGIIPSWLGCSSHYLNIVYYVKGSYSVSHSVNLVENRVNPDYISSDTLFFELRHNDFNDFQPQELRGVSSFNLAPFMDANKTGLLKINISFYSYYQGLSSVFLEYDFHEHQVIDYSNTSKSLGSRPVPLMVH